MVGEEYTLNLIDAPGHFDFSSEVAAAVSITDGIAVVVSCEEGVDLRTERLINASL